MALQFVQQIRRVARLGLTFGLAGLVPGVALAGNVQVALEGSLLKITGSNTADSISLVQTAAGMCFVTAGTGTTISGRNSVVLRRVSLNAIDLRMEGGNDSVSTRGLRVANDFFVNLGAGNDRLVTSGPVTVGANWAIEGEAGNDVIRLVDATVGQDLYVDGGLGSLNANISGLEGGKSLTVISDEAADQVVIVDSIVAELVAVESKAGNDRISISGAAAFGMSLNTDMGADVVEIDGFMAQESVGIFTGTGNDLVTLRNLMAGTTIDVSVDLGDDRVSGESVSAGTDAVFLGGDGTDTLTDLGIQGEIKKEIKEFENVLP